MNNNNSLHRQIHYSNHFKVFVNKHLFMPESKSVSYKSKNYLLSELSPGIKLD